MKVALFDLDDTLYAYNPCHEEGLFQLTSYLVSTWGISKEEVLTKYDSSRKLVHAQLKETAASHHRLLYMTKLCESFGKNPITYSKHLEEVYWKGYFSKMELDENVIPIFEGLIKRNVKIAIVTDLVAEIQYRKLLHLGLENYISVIVTSEEAGADKPNPAIFNLALNKLKMNSPEDAIFIGDSYSKDIVGANSIGIKAFWVSNDSDPVKSNSLTIQVRDLKTLRGIIFEHV
ncbi:HAD family hydrolase [Leptospira levettii]|uniref:HAD family hydrolase n=1 Tax=Leptospira levettii TaxID=2023178 RepID=UPI000C2A5B1A|nr:HAD family hydrolase [Leptospira levettii]PJZ89440.1 hypothetical protein CH368_06665 [Leptospira levettii]